MSARYDRAPSPALLELLDGDRLLAPMRRAWTVGGIPLDLQFREKDHVHLYCGLTRLVTARRTHLGIPLHSAASYTLQPCAARLFRPWSLSESGFGEALAGYLAEVHVDARGRNSEGLRRMLEVKAVVDRHLPAGIEEVGVWALRRGEAYRVV